jgi:hypothetical protein
MVFDDLQSFPGLLMLAHPGQHLIMAADRGTFSVLGFDFISVFLPKY